MSAYKRWSLVLIAAVMLTSTHVANGFPRDAAQSYLDHSTRGSDQSRDEPKSSATTSAPITRSAQVFRSVAELSPPQDASQAILNGVTPANPRDWAAIFYTKTDVGFCTASLVGPRVLLTAAHCIASNDRVSITQGSTEISGTCVQHADFSAGIDKSADYALCALDRDVSGVSYERVGQSFSALQEGSNLLLSGFGCRNSDEMRSGTFAIGTATIARVSDTNNFIITDGKASVCFGDSGGPAFVTRGGRDGKHRLLVAINSVTYLNGASVLVSINTPAARSFLKSWREQHHLFICGEEDKGHGCRAWGVP